MHFGLYDVSAVLHSWDVFVTMDNTYLDILHKFGHQLNIFNN